MSLKKNFIKTSRAIPAVLSAFCSRDHDARKVIKRETEGNIGVNPAMAIVRQTRTKLSLHIVLQ